MATRVVTMVSLLFLAACAASPERTMTDGPDPRYWRYDRIVTTLDGWANDHPDFVHVEDIGRTHQGEGIRAVRIGRGERTLLFVGAQHANEPNGTGALMVLAERLIGGYGKDPAVTAWVDGISLWLVPVMNVDGHRHVFAGGPGYREWRKNGRDNDGDGVRFGPEDGVDLNRNWDHRFDLDKSIRRAGRSYKGPEPFSEPESRAVRDLVLRERPLLFVDLHSPGKITPPNVIFWPWFEREAKREGPDAAVFRPLAQAVAARTETEVDGEFLSGDSYGFDTLPKAQNWVYAKTGACALLVEISARFWWEGEIVDVIAERFAKGLTVLLDRAVAGPGLAGRVVEAGSGAPLAAVVRVAEHHRGGIGPYRTDPATGRFGRLLNPGEVTVEILAEGYSSIREKVMIQEAEWTQREFRMVRSE